jgi:hypothetical protein
MPLQPLSPSAFAFIAEVEQAYARLMCNQPSLGGKLLYAGELDEPGRALACAANIAGAATLAASANQAARKQAMREGIVDFLVTSLDEALRILKNQIRKREPVSVCVGAATEVVEREMQERGVLPDLVRPLAAPQFARGSMRAPVVPDRVPDRVLDRLPDHVQDRVVDREEAGVPGEPMQWLTWRVATEPALWLPQLDAIALACLPPGAGAARRWLQKAPRYLGRLAQGAHVLHTSEKLAAQLIAQMAAHVESRQIAATIEIELGPWDNSRHRKLVPSP